MRTIEGNKYEATDWPVNLLWAQVLEVKEAENELLVYVKTEFDGFEETWNLEHFRAGLRRGFYRRIWRL